MAARINVLSKRCVGVNRGHVNAASNFTCSNNEASSVVVVETVAAAAADDEEDEDEVDDRDDEEDMVRVAIDWLQLREGRLL